MNLKLSLGSNLLHFLYLNCPRQNASFGGDYNIFCDHVRDIFRMLKKCNIRAIIIFDGGLDLGDRKQKTRLLRAKQKIIASIKVKPSNQHRYLTIFLLTNTKSPINTHRDQSFFLGIKHSCLYKEHGHCTACLTAK